MLNLQPVENQQLIKSVRTIVIKLSIFNETVYVAAPFRVRCRHGTQAEACGYKNVSLDGLSSIDEFYSRYVRGQF